MFFFNNTLHLLHKPNTMKILNFIFLLLLSGIAAKGQNVTSATNSTPASSSSGNNKTFASAGCVELGGSISYTNTSESYINSNGNSISNLPVTMLLFAPYVGYFPVQGFELGVNPLSISSANSYGTTGTTLLF